MNTQHTPGPWDAYAYRKSADTRGAMVRVLRPATVHCRANPDICEVYAIGDDGASGGEMEANAVLIAEAGTVTTETGLTPRQLADQRADLLAALEQWIKEFDDNGWPKAPHADGCQCGPCLARAAIAKAKGA